MHPFCTLCLDAHPIPFAPAPSPPNSDPGVAASIRYADRLNRRERLAWVKRQRQLDARKAAKNRGPRRIAA